MTKIIVERKRNMMGRPTPYWVASFAGWTAEGDSRENALDKLETQLTRQEAFLHTKRYLVCPAGMFVLSYAAGWQYDIVRPDGTCSSCMLTCETYMQALEQMTRHFEQWKLDVAA